MCASVNFLLAKGIPAAEIIAKLKSKGNYFYYDGEFIEHAYFVKPDEPINPNGCTWASAMELLEICQKSDKPEVGIPWSDWDYRAKNWCVPAYNFLLAKGVPSATIIANLKSKDGSFYYGDKPIKGAYFVKADAAIKPNGCTWAPATALLELCQEPGKPEVGIPWTDWDYHDKNWCVPVYNFLMAKGVPSATIISNLKSTSTFYYGGKLLEGAYFFKADALIKPKRLHLGPGCGVAGDLSE